MSKFTDIQENWRVLEGKKPLDSLGDVSAAIIDDYYANMKSKITNEEHNHWADILTRRHIEYAAKDAYAAFEIWNRITTVQKGIARAMEEKEKTSRKRPRESWGRSCGKGGWGAGSPSASGWD